MAALRRRTRQRRWRPHPSWNPRAPTSSWAQLLVNDDEALSLGEVRNVTDHPGYDNQPTFLSGGGFLFTRQDGEHTDIWRWDPNTDQVTPVTRTEPESEYSATPMPSGDGFSAVRVEADSTQRLWRFGMDGTAPSVLLPDVAPVGYHAWFDTDTLALFVLGDPATLRLATVSGGNAQIVATDIGRSLQPVPGRHAVSFVQHDEEGATRIRIWDLDRGDAEDYAPGLDGGDYHAWTPAGVLLQASGSTLYRWDTASPGWQPVAELDGVTLSRLAVSPDGRWIALVADAAGQEG